MPSVNLKVVTFCAYLTDIDKPWRPEDHRCLKMVKALKGTPINGSFSVVVDGAVRHFTQANVADFVRLIPNKIAQGIKANFEREFCLVPIPNSPCTATNDPEFKTRKLTEAIAQRLDVDCVPCLVFKEAQTPSRKGGPRDPYHFEAAYRLLKPYPTKPIILIDDVFTTGSHVQGACWKLQSAGLDVVGAVAFGRTTKEQETKPLSTEVHGLSLSKGIFDFSEPF